MEPSETFSAIRVAAAICVLAYASLLDLRTRRVGNRYWVALSILGGALLSVQVYLDEMPLEYLAILVPIALILSDVFIDNKLSERGARWLVLAQYASAIIILLLLTMQYGSESYFQHLIAVPAMMLFVVLLYMLDAIRGGADAKSLIALAILFPFYPVIGQFPFLRAEEPSFEILLPFTFSILVMAAIIVGLTPIGFLLRNLGNGETRFPQALLGYKMDVESARDRHVWLMERIIDGRHVIYSRPKGEEDLGKELALLADAGHKRVWVTPKIPFIVPMLIGLIVCIIIGSPLLLLFPL